MSIKSYYENLEKSCGVKEAAIHLLFTNPKIRKFGNWQINEIGEDCVLLFLKEDEESVTVIDFNMKTVKSFYCVYEYAFVEALNW